MQMEGFIVFREGDSHPIITPMHLYQFLKMKNGQTIQQAILNHIQQQYQDAMI